MFIINHDGERYRKNTVSRKFVLALRKLNINGSFHNLRHTFASELIEKGIDIETVRELLGHASWVTTQIYSHTTEQRKFEAVNKL